MGTSSCDGPRRTAQEALANARKHARASNVTVTLSYFPDLTVLDVQDDGVGFYPNGAVRTAGAAGGVGLSSMRERIGELGGTVEIESTLQEGTTVVVQLPNPPRRQPGLPGSDEAR